MKTNENGFTNKGHKEKDRLQESYKKKIKISLKMNLMSRPNQNIFQPKQ